MTKEELNLPQVQVNFHRPLPEACRLLVLGGKMFDMQKLEVVLIEEELGL